MNAKDVQSRFNRCVGLGDSLLRSINLQTGAASCRFTFEYAVLLKDDENASYFDPVAVYKPACLEFSDVHSLSFGAAEYQLNSTVVAQGARDSRVSGLIEFYFDLTGGADPDAFMARLSIVARDFSFGPCDPESEEGNR